MLRLLVGLRVRTAWNRLWRGGGRRELRVLGALLAGAFGFIFVVLAGLNTSILVQRLARIDAQAPSGVLPALLVGGAMLSLVTSLSTAFHHLFMAADEELLLVSPVAQRDLFALKLLETWRDSVHVVLFEVAALSGFGIAVGEPAIYFGVAVAMALLLTMAGSLAGMLLTLAVARIRFGGAVLGASRLLSILLFVPLGVLGVPALALGRRGGLLLSQDTLQTAAATLRTLNAPPEWAPTTWGVHLLLVDERAVASSVLLAVMTLVLLAAASFGFERAYQPGWERVRFAGPRAAAKRSARWRGPRLPVRGPLLSMLLKDVRMLLRDPRWRTGLLVSLVALGVPMLLVSTSTDPGPSAPSDARFWIGLFPVPYLAYVAGSQHGAASLAYEGRNLALLRAVPVGFGRLLLAKLAGSLVLVLGITWLATLVLALRHGPTPIQLVAAFAAAAWLAIGGTLAGLVGAALTADFETDNPQRRVGCLGTLVTSALEGAFFATNTGLLVWLVLRTFGGLPRGLLFFAPVLDWVIVGVALAAVGGLLVAARFGAQRLANWEAS